MLKAAEESSQSSMRLSRRPWAAWWWVMKWAGSLAIPAMFCERVDGVFVLRRGFGLEKGQRVLIVEDVVTTGKSSMEAVACIKEYGATPVAVASLIDRRSQNDVSLTLPLISLLKLDIPTYKPDALPEELKAVPAVKPGSRFT